MLRKDEVIPTNNNQEVVSSLSYGAVFEQHLRFWDEVKVKRMQPMEMFPEYLEVNKVVESEQTGQEEVDGESGNRSYFAQGFIVADLPSRWLSDDERNMLWVRAEYTLDFLSEFVDEYMPVLERVYFEAKFFCDKGISCEACWGFSPNRVTPYVYSVTDGTGTAQKYISDTLYGPENFSEGLVKTYDCDIEELLFAGLEKKTAICEEDRIMMQEGLQELPPEVKNVLGYDAD